MRGFRARRRERKRREQSLRERAEHAEEQARSDRAEAGAYRDALTALASGTIPPELLAAARSAPHDGQAVKVTIDGCEVIAVIGDEGGSPAEWIAAISADLRRRRAS